MRTHAHTNEHKGTSKKESNHVTPTASIEIYRDGRKVAAQYRSGDLSFFADRDSIRQAILEVTALCERLTAIWTVL